MWYGKNARKQRSNGESYQESSQQRYCIDGQTNDTTKNIGVGWRGIGRNGRARDPREEK